MLQCMKWSVVTDIWRFEVSIENRISACYVLSWAVQVDSSYALIVRTVTVAWFITMALYNVHIVVTVLLHCVRLLASYVPGFFAAGYRYSVRGFVCFCSCVCLLYVGTWCLVSLCLLFFVCLHQFNWLPRKTHLRNVTLTLSWLMSTKLTARQKADVEKSWHWGLGGRPVERGGKGEFSRALLWLSTGLLECWE